AQFHQRLQRRVGGMRLGPLQRGDGLVQLLVLYLLFRAVADREQRVRRLGVVLHQLVDEGGRRRRLAAGQRHLRLLVQGGRRGLVVRLVLAPLLQAEDADQADRDADGDGEAVLAQPFLDTFALFVIVVCVKCHASPFVGTARGARRQAGGEKKTARHHPSPVPGRRMGKHNRNG